MEVIALRIGFRTFIHSTLIPLLSCSQVDFNTQSKDKHSVKHEWLCDGKLLLLEDPRSPDNMGIFQVGLRISYSQYVMYISYCTYVRPTVFPCNNVLKIPQNGHFRVPAKMLGRELPFEW